jgi:hypothetical protein
MYTVGASDNGAEGAALTASGWTLEGNAFSVRPKSYGTTNVATDFNPDLVTVPLVRLFHPNTGSHLLSVSESEVINIARGDWLLESLNLGYVFAEDPQDGSTPVYRLHNGSNNDYLYTDSLDEANVAVSNHGYVLEADPYFWASGPDGFNYEVQRYSSP